MSADSAAGRALVLDMSSRREDAKLVSESMPDGLARVAPWVLARRSIWWESWRVPLGLVAAALILIYLLIIRGLMLCLGVLQAMLNFLGNLVARHFGMVVEYVYRLRICKLHVVFARYVQRNFFQRPYHSRYADLRTEVALKGGGKCFIHAVPYLTDNFCYVLVDASAKDSQSPAGQGFPTCAVDVGDAKAVTEALEYLAREFYANAGGLRFEAVLCTHRHWDHAGGNEDLIRLASDRASQAAQEGYKLPKQHDRQEGYRVLPPLGSHSDTEVPSSALDEAPEQAANMVHYAHPLPVYAGRDEEAPGCSRPLQHGMQLRVGKLELEAVASPGHTEGHLMFRLLNAERAWLSAKERPDLEPADAVSGDEARRQADVLFSGDTLFSGGCGACFEGCALDMEHCFATILETCSSPDALLFPGHEYTSRLLTGNLEEALGSWCATTPPGHFLALCGAFYVAKHRRALHDKIPTVPVTLNNERLVNTNFHSLLQHADVLYAAAEARWREVQAQPSPAAGEASEPRSQPSEREPVSSASILSPCPPSKAVSMESAQDEGLPLLAAEHGISSDSGTGTIVTPQPEPVVSASNSAPESDVALSNEQPSRGDENDKVIASPSVDPGSHEEQTAPDLKSTSAGEVQAKGEIKEQRPSDEERTDPASTQEEKASATSAEFLACPSSAAYQFSYFYRSELQALQTELAEGRISGPDAAARLDQCQRNLFSTPLLTGEGDAFNNDGMNTALEEHGESKLTEIGQKPQSQPQDEVECFEERDIIDALKVLGVLPEVPVGPKAPCADLEMPVSISRLDNVMRVLDVPSEGLEALRTLLHSPGSSAATEPPADDFCMECWSGSIPSAVTHVDSSKDVQPLRQVLRSLCPAPAEEEGPLRRIASRCQRVLQSACDSCSWSTTPVRAEASDEDENTASARGSVPMDVLMERHKAAEQEFSSHALHECPLCCSSFRRRRGSERASGL